MGKCDLARAQNGKLTKKIIGKMANLLNGKLTKWHIGKMTS